MTAYRGWHARTWLVALMIVTAVCGASSLRHFLSAAPDYESGQELLAAARLNDLAAAKSAFAKDSSAIRATDESQCTPLHEAARYADAEFVEWLVGQGADVNARCYNNFTPLHLTTDPAIARILVKAGAKLGLVDAFGDTPLGRAVGDENQSLIDFYLSQGEKLTFDQCVAIGKANEVAAMLEERPWLAKPPSNTLHTAARAGDVAMVKLLLRYHADPNHSIDFINASGAYTPFSAAVLGGHYEAARELAQRGAEMDVAGGKLVPNLFHHVAGAPDSRFVKLMLEHGVDLHSTDGFEPMTPLHVAAFQGHVANCKLLIEAGARVEAKTSDGATPLYFAAAANRKAVCELLVSHGAKFDIWSACALGDVAAQPLLADDPKSASRPDRRLHRAPIIWAAQSGNLELVELLLKSGAVANVTAPSKGSYSNVVSGPLLLGDVEKVGDTPLHVAAQFGHLAIVRRLVDAGAPLDILDESNDTPLGRAVEAGHVEVVRFLIEKGADVDRPSGGRSPLAASVRSPAIFRLLLATGKAGVESQRAALADAARLNADEVGRELIAAGVEADLFAACSFGLRERVEELLRDDPPAIDRPQNDYPRARPLELAIERGQVTLAKWLIDRGAVVEVKGEWSALATAARCGQLEIAKVLRAKTDVRSKDGMGKTPLHAAAQDDQDVMIDWLLKEGADVEARDVYGATPLHSAAYSGATKAVRRLLAAGADVDSRNKERETPLHSAALGGQPETAALLIANKADVNARTVRGKTPLFWAERAGWRENEQEAAAKRRTAEVLRSAGGVK